jgi:hypothetical protein
MSAITVAQGRRGDRIKTIDRQIASLNKDIARGVIGAGGMPDAYLTERREYLASEVKRLEAEIVRLGQLSDNDLVQELVPEAARAAVIADKDNLKRGHMVPQAVEVHREPPPVRRDGGDPVTPWDQMGSGAATPGVVWTYRKDADGNFNLVRA